MEEVFGAIFLVLCIIGAIFSYKSCQQQDHEQVIERRKQCFEATKDQKCFYELKESK